MAHIVIVDDDLPVLEMICHGFEGAGHSVAPVVDPRTVQPMLVERLPDAMVLDVMMPGLSGWQVLAAVRADLRTRALPVLMLSARHDVGSRVRSLREGADDYLAKPFELSELLVRVEGLIARRQDESSDLVGRLDAHPLPELVQSLERAGTTGVLEIQTSSAVGRLVLDAGTVARVDFAGLTDEEALLALFEVRAGGFRFHPGPAADKEQSPAGRSLSVSIHHLLLTAAWLEDEVQARAHNLPDAETRLRVVRPPGTVPPQVAKLPVRGVIDAIELQRPRACELFEAPVAAPNRVRLALIWLIDQGFVEAVSSPPDDPVDVVEPARPMESHEPTDRQGPAAPHEPVDDGEAFDTAVRELAQMMMFRRGEVGPLRLRVVYAGQGWMQLRSVIARSETASRDREAVVSLASARRGTLRLPHEVADVTLEIAPAGDPEPVSPCCAVVLLVGAGVSPAHLVALLNEVEETPVPELGCLLMAHAEEPYRTVLGAVGSQRGWRFAAALPRRLEDLLLAVAEGAL